MQSELDASLFLPASVPPQRVARYYWDVRYVGTNSSKIDVFENEEVPLG